MTREDQQRERVRSALWRAFPEARSEHELAELARDYFRDKSGDPVSARTILYWLRGQSLPSFGHTMTLIAMVGPEYFFPLWDAEVAL